MRPNQIEDIAKFTAAGVEYDAHKAIEDYKSWYDEVHPMTPSRQAVRAAISIVETFENRINELEAKLAHVSDTSKKPARSAKPKSKKTSKKRRASSVY